MDVEKYFSDYDAFAENIIAHITPQGISLENGKYIDFNECAEVYAEAIHGGDPRCIGECELSDLSFTFYTLPKAVMIKFMGKDSVTNLCRFHDLQKKIYEYEYRMCHES